MITFNDELIKIVQREKVAADIKHGKIHSPHEGIAVLFEEMQETEEALNSVKKITNIMWASVRLNHNAEYIRCAKYAYSIAIKCAAEAIQMAAVAKRIEESEGGKWV